ncbi:hypothetical protein MRB53_035246 [Persea americana]|uniref:Uncharacterized protein n=1 Tax=Persea americana TaxID=3435 RepID=A0ACC2K462_PERAE|nr:hypothetical protein MRB53_035246 [Persea americana]
MKGVPVHVWSESVFRKSGDCLGRTLKVDKKTIDKESLVFRRVKVMLGGDVQLPTKLSLWFEDLMTSVAVEEDDVSVVFEGVPGRGSYNMRGMLFASSGSVDEEDNDDVRLTDELSNLKSPSSVDEFNSFSKVGSIVNSSPRALFCLERSTPDDFSSYPSSPVVALGDRGAENRGELQIVPAIAPINSAGFNTPTTSSGHVARNSWRPECSSQYRKSSDILSPIIRLVLYSSDSDDFSSPMKEACADDCDTEPTPISAYEWDS